VAGEDGTPVALHDVESGLASSDCWRDSGAMTEGLRREIERAAIVNP
jgi:hypothetical protein